MTCNDEVEIDLPRLLRALWRNAWAIILSLVISGGAFFGGSILLIQPLYTAEALMYVNSSDISLGGSKASISQSELTAAQTLVDTYIVIMNSRTTMDAVIAQAGVSYTYEEIMEKQMVSASSVNGTEVFSIRVTSPSPGEATLLANTIADVLPSKIASIVEGSSARIVDYAVTPTEPSSPNILKNTAIGAVLGFLLSCGIIVMKALLDDQIHDSEYLSQTFGLPVLAKIPNSISPEESHAASLPFAAAEAYKLLRTNLNFSTPNVTGCKVLGITSTMKGEGKSTTAVNIAYTMAQEGGKVLLIECDLRSPVLAKRIQVNPAPGLSNFLVGRCSSGEVLQKSGLRPNLWVMTAGDLPPNPAELLGSDNLATTIQTLKDYFDVILLDLPPLTAVSDALVVSKLIHGMLLVVKQDYCSQPALDEALRQLRFANATILGFVMTHTHLPSRRYGNPYTSYTRNPSK